MSTETGASGPEPGDIASHHRGKAAGVAIAAAMGGFLFGFDTSVINGAVDSITDTYSLSDTVTGLVVAIALVGSAVGAWNAGVLADKWGRPKVMAAGALFFFVSSIGSALCFAAWDLALWRFIGGLGIGIASVIAPTYISETAPANLRGRLASLQQLAIVLGIFIALLVEQWLASGSGGAMGVRWLGLEAWRWMFLVGVIPAALYGILSQRIPESPRYLVAKGRDAEAAQVLARLLGKSEEEATADVARIRSSIDTEARPTFDDLRGPRLGLRPIVWVGILLAVFQQFVGINVIFYYSDSLWESVGFGESFAFTASVITSIVNVVVTVVAILLIDSWGRRKLLLIGSLGMFASLAVMALGFAQATVVVDAEGVPQPQLDGAWGVATLIAANAFVVFFGSSWGPVMWVLLSEMFPNSIRALAMALATAANWIANFVITLTFPVLRDFSLGFTYAIYAFFALVSFFFVLRKIAETKGKELESMSMETVSLGR